MKRNYKYSDNQLIMDFKREADTLRKSKGIKPSIAHEELARKKGFNTYLGFIAHALKSVD